MARALPVLRQFMLAATGLGWGILNSGKRGSTVAGIPPTTSAIRSQAPAVAPTTPDATPGPQGGGSPIHAPAQPTTPPAEPTPTTAAAVSGLTKVAGPTDVAVNQSLDFTLPTGDPAVLVHNDSGYSAYIAICTHDGCQVSYFPQYKIIGCPCHGAEFDAANGGQVLRGPARRPLAPSPLQSARTEASTWQGEA